MTEHAEIERPARLALLAYAAWSVVLGAWGRSAPFFPASARLAAGVALAVACLIAALAPTFRRVELALFAVTGYALWSAARVLSADFNSAASITGAVTYAITAVSALTIAAMTAILAGIEQAAEAHRGDE